ncbi:hypothetical protein M438DRAFT_311681 [Aureobasidium pullulans EXF-150]|uniref:VPS9 domain-containing protein n=1 Tax=Aureobasidium pullulans EXF-150 TaxID=1043002 RepID=A0A074XZ57_AURPU|nr:uncharacterized protein M438DRAFT_311681 [Aureobasidium pullulans EXF-150]KEQ88924.1 hypothetical protein M438DRAFT_311681 [Aureobasidium pullulans EXF-150]
MSNSSSPKQAPRPRPLHVSRSFTRLDPNPESLPASPSRARASTIQTIPEAKDMTSFSHGDVFESVEEDSHEEPAVNVPPTFDQLPIEIRSLSERFLKSLSVKTHANPLNIDTISELFQDFYEQAESHISTHIATLSTRLSREKSPSRSVASKASNATLKGRKQSADQNASPNGQGEQQMLTASEVADRRKARRDLEIKRLALEEAVERAVCEKVYDRIYRHRSADDEERDAKLRSRTAALSLVGIGLKELHVDIEPAKGNGLPTDEKELHEEIFKLLAPAREHLQRMDDHRYPLGKLQMLTEAHKSIVETLSRIFPSTSSADEVLPTLIYTLMTSDPETINVISNLHFVQLFRARAKVDGEAAYCLVNLEAAISFLETVDLSSLRADEAPQGRLHPETRHERPTNFARPSSPKSLAPGLTTTSAISSDLSPGDTSLKPLPSPNTLANNPVRPGFTQRRFSSLIQAQAERIEAGREELLNSADQAFDAINSTLENSFKFLFGRMKEQGAGTEDSPIVMPRTLEDARKLVSSPPLVPMDSHPNFAESLSASPTADPLSAPRVDNTMLNLVGGRLRERSVDSNRSASSGKRVIFAEKPNAALINNSISSSLPTQSAVESMGNLMNSINPLSRFGGFGKFGRSASATNNVQPETDLDTLEALAALKKATPPVQKFIDAKNAQDLRIKDVDELLRDYQRLAALIKETINA